MASTDEVRLRDVVDAVVTRAGYDLEELTVVAAGRRRMLRVVIDRDAGVDLDDAAAVSRDISAELDESAAADPMGGAPYTLEVTSPGIGRPLTRPRHFRRARGRLLAITDLDGGLSTGRVLWADEEQVELLVGRHGTDPRSLPYTAIARARVEVEFSAPSPAVLALLDAETAGKFDHDVPADHGADDDDDQNDDDHDDDHDHDDHDDDDDDDEHHDSEEDLTTT